MTYGYARRGARARTVEAAPELVEPSSADACAATRAATPVRFPTARWASARCASIAAARCGCRWATSAACSAIRSRRSRSSTRIPGRWPSASACSAATCTARYCQNWVTSQALRDPQAVAPPLDVTPEELVASRRLGGARRRQHLQRAAHHQRVGGRDLQGGARARADDGVRLERQRHAAGARLHPAVDRSLQGRSQELRRPALPPARRTPRADLDTIRALHAMGCGSRS